MRNAQEIVANLEKLDVRSVEFYDEAARYFCARFRVVRNCALFFYFLATVSLALLVIHWRNWPLVISSSTAYFLALLIAYGPFRLGWHGARAIKLARELATHQRLETLRSLAALKPFCRDPVAATILQRIQ